LRSGSLQINEPTWQIFNFTNHQQPTFQLCKNINGYFCALKLYSNMLQITINDKNGYAIAREDAQWTINERAADLDIRKQPNGLISVLYNGKSFTAIVEKVDTKNKELTLRIDGQPYKLAIQEPIDQLLSSMGLDLKSMQKVEPVKAPMPGMVLKVLVEPGQQINKGDGLLILEAMKMENVLKASGPATVKAIKVNERTAVEKGAVLIEME
jgi:biotin carboxyl carrier protein